MGLQGSKSFLGDDRLIQGLENDLFSLSMRKPYGHLLKEADRPTTVFRFKNLALSPQTFNRSEVAQEASSGSYASIGPVLDRNPRRRRPESTSLMATQWNAIAALVSVKLNRDNYLLWSSQLESVMESQELIQFIDGTFPTPSETIVKDGKSEVNPEFTVWKRSDRLALSWIKATVSEPVLKQIVTSNQRLRHGIR
ncbi:hypothetical protein EJ110_NYTH51202 [Nymphaea thermarum]|nr:hypothetical protein EJ110_NYTH51202 [Nymphaea thermarum]